MSLLLAMELKVAKLISKLRIHGDQVGEQMDIFILPELGMAKVNAEFREMPHSLLYDKYSTFVHLSISNSKPLRYDFKHFCKVKASNTK